MNLVENFRISPLHKMKNTSLGPVTLCPLEVGLTFSSTEAMFIQVLGYLIIDHYSVL